MINSRVIKKKMNYKKYLKIGQFSFAIGILLFVFGLLIYPPVTPTPEMSENQEVRKDRNGKPIFKSVSIREVEKMTKPARTAVHVAIFLMVLGSIVLLVAKLKRPKYNQPVYNNLPPIIQEYYKCKKCNSFDGGIYGKGPLKSFRSEKANKCIHKWGKIKIEEFAQGVNEHFSIDWRNESMPFWKKLNEYIKKEKK